MDYNLRVIEELNMEYIRLNNSIVRKKQRYSIKDVVDYLRRKYYFKSIELEFATENMPYDRQMELARLGPSNKKFVVYTCVLGKYDKVKKPVILFDNTDYVCFSETNAEGWENCGISENISNSLDGDNSIINRYYKFHPFELFEKKYDYSIYLDGCVTPVSDLSVLSELVNPQYGIALHKHCSRKCVYQESRACIAQKKGRRTEIERLMDSYKAESYPRNYGLLEASVIVTDLKNEVAKNFYKNLWSEFINSSCKRDQLIIPHCLWKMGINPENVGTLGNNLYLNPKIRVLPHNK